MVGGVSVISLCQQGGLFALSVNTHADTIFILNASDAACFHSLAQADHNVCYHGSCLHFCTPNRFSCVSKSNYPQHVPYIRLLNTGSYTLLNIIACTERITYKCIKVLLHNILMSLLQLYDNSLSGNFFPVIQEKCACVIQIKKMNSIKDKF